MCVLKIVYRKLNKIQIVLKKLFFNGIRWATKTEKNVEQNLYLTTSNHDWAFYAKPKNTKKTLHILRVSNLMIFNLKDWFLGVVFYTILRQYADFQ